MRKYPQPSSLWGPHHKHFHSNRSAQLKKKESSRNWNFISTSFDHRIRINFLFNWKNISPKNRKWMIRFILLEKHSSVATFQESEQLSYYLFTKPFVRNPSHTKSFVRKPYGYGRFVTKLLLYRTTKSSAAVSRGSFFSGSVKKSFSRV